MKRSGVCLRLCLVLAAFGGCSAKGDVMPIQLTPVAQSAAAKPEAVVAVVPFEDLRTDGARLGTRAHLWGGQSTFEIPGAKPGDAVAKAVHDYLKAKGWNVRMVKAQDGGDADVVLTGKIVTLSVDAVSKFMKTDMSAATKIGVQAQNRADESTVRMTLNGSGSQRVVWFDPDDAEKLLNDVLTESLEKLTTDTRFDNRMMRLK